jgi:hypothetical protein
MVRLLPHLEHIELPLGTVLYESGEALRHVYFPVDCIISRNYSRPEPRAPVVGSLTM